MTAAADAVRALSVQVADFPSPGIVFRDLTPVFEDVDGFAAVVSELTAPWRDQFDAVLGIEARGFLLAAAIGVTQRRPVLVARKSGKLPGAVIREEYDLEYGSAALEMSARRPPAGARILVVDDVLATGGTAAAAVRLATRLGYVVVGVAVVFEIPGLGARDVLDGTPVHSIVSDSE